MLPLHHGRAVSSVARVRLGALGAGALLVLFAEVGPLEELSFELLSVHLLQNVILMEWAPGLLVLGLAPGTGRRLAAYTPWWAALPIWLVTTFVWHLPPLYDAALRNPHSLLHLEHVCYLVAGIVFWLPIVHGGLPYGARAAYVFAAFLLASPVGLLLALLPQPIYEFYDGAHGLSALADQQVAGITMASEQAIVFFAVFSVFVLKFFREEE